jgi:D-alanyl-lipoteichoic acid acyltransferase DltB (MBOAT superfamily)
MLFNSLEYGAFLLVVFATYFALPQRYRVGFLLVASYYFYMRWKWEYGFHLLAVTALNYVAGRQIGLSTRPLVRRAWMAAALTGSLGMLVYYKYFNFFNESARAVVTALGFDYLVPHLDVLLPVGISFYVFQSLSYTIDVYRGAHGVETSFNRFALYVVFFPQLVAGPIERATHLLDQFRRENRVEIERITSGLKLILWGLFKKVVIADRLALYVDNVYGSPEIHTGTTLLLATYFFAFQIYCDFSGYSDIAIGSARILGYDLMQNFRLPYLAQSISDFWQRWHISLTSWFRSYVYVPLGGNRVSYRRWLFNVFAVFLLSGLWHGANWTFVAWGGLHGLFYYGESLLRRNQPAGTSVLDAPGLLPSIARVLVTFHLVLLAWVFFRAATIEQALLILGRIFTDLGGSLYWGPSQLTTVLSVALIGLLLLVQVLQSRGLVSLYLSQSGLPAEVRWPGYVGLIVGIAVFGLSSSAFIYFQF